MNNSKTPKIVVGVGLAAVYATGLAIFTLRGMHDNVVAQNAADAPIAQIAAAPIPPAAIVPASTETTTSVAEQPAAVTVAPSPVAGAAAKALRVPSPAVKSEVEKSSPTSEGATAGNELANSTGEAPSSVQPESASPGNDVQITADVKSQMAAVALAGTIDVTTRDGVVELTGSVPSQEEIDKARLAARTVADVRDVDVSALMISN